MVTFKHDGTKYRLKFAFNEGERGTVEGEKSGKYLKWHGLTVMVVNARWRDEEGHAVERTYIVEAHCSISDDFNRYFGMRAALDNWLQDVSTRDDGLREVAWKAFLDKYQAKIDVCPQIIENWPKQIIDNWPKTTKYWLPKYIDVSGWQ